MQAKRLVKISSVIETAHNISNLIAYSDLSGFFASSPFATVILCPAFRDISVIKFIGQFFCGIRKCNLIRYLNFSGGMLLASSVKSAGGTAGKERRDFI